MKKFFFAAILLTLLPLTALAANSLGILNESIAVGKVLSIGLNPSSSGSWYLGNNTNDSVASASVSASALLVKGLQAGTTAISVCTDTNGANCLLANVTVNPAGNVLGESIVLPHSAGSWILSGKTVYYVTSAGLIPISTWKIFLSNGGKASLIQPANSSDMNLKKLSLMKPHDSRVKK